MLDKLVFYNHFGAGDIFESREFVKDYMKQFPAKEYWYAHGKHPRILADMPELRYTPIDDSMNCRMPFFNKGNSLYVNTWYQVLAFSRFIVLRNIVHVFL